MILTPFFQKAKLRVNEEMQIIMPNTATMIIISNLHKMHLTLEDDGQLVKSRIAPIPSTPSTVREGSPTQAIVKALGNMTVMQSHALLLEEMHKLHVHLTDKLAA